MNCEKAFDRYLSLDRHERVPFAVTLHLLVCPACRTAVRSLTRAESSLAAPYLPACPKNPSADPVIAAAMARIQDARLAYPEVFAGEHRVSMSRWLVSGVGLIAGFTIMPFSAMGEWSRVVFGSAFSIPFYLLCGIGVTVYCGIFVGTNIDFFVKKFGFERMA